jgi:hypothetical protein
MKILNCHSILLGLFILLFPHFVQAQQLKLGASPAVLEKSALLDLNSDRQGLLLPRVSDYTVTPLSNAPDGMLIYYVPEKLLYIRKNGIWRKLIDETNGIISVNGQTSSIVNLTTNNITESGNLYYTDERARAAFSAGTGINLTAAGVISALNSSAIWNASQLQGRNISTNTPANNDVLTWDNTTGTWLPKAVTASGGGGSFGEQERLLVFASPVWNRGTPGFRALDALDIPNISADKITSGVLPTARGGIGMGWIGGAGQMLRVNGAGNALEWSGDYVPMSSTINMNGDVSGTGNFYYINTTLNNFGTAGTYTKVITDAKGRVSWGTTLSSGDIPELDASKITSGILPASRGGTGLTYIGAVGQSIRINSTGNGFEYYTPSATAGITLTGDITGTGTSSISTTLANSGVTAGTYTKVTVDAKGRVTTGSNLLATDIPAGSTQYIQNITSGIQPGSYAIGGNGSVGGTFSLPAMTAGSVLFMGADGAVSQNNPYLFWDINNRRLGLGTATPNNTLEVAGSDAATGRSGLRLKDLNGVTAQSPNSKVLSINDNGDVIVTQNAATNNWLITGNSNINTDAQFLGTLNDRKMVIKSNNASLLEFGRRQTLNLIDNYDGYTDGDEKVTYVRSALQFEVPSTVEFYKPKMWTTAEGNFRMKGASAGTDFFEFGATGSNNNGGFEFIIGDDGTEPIVFKSYLYSTPAYTEIMRLQGSNVGIGLAGATPAKRLHIDANNDAIRIANLATGGTGTNNPLVVDPTGDVRQATALNGVTVGVTTPAAGSFTTLSVSRVNLTLTAGTNNNINISTGSFIRITGPAAAFTITGIAAGTDGRVVTLYNSTGQNMTIANDATSTAANRILTMSGANMVTTGAGTVTMIYSTTDARWIVTAFNP